MSVSYKTIIRACSGCGNIYNSMRPQDLLVGLPPSVSTAKKVGNFNLELST